MAVTVGYDPECWFENRDDEIIPAHLLTEGTKYRPKKLNGYFNSIMADGTAVEFTTPPTYYAVSTYTIAYALNTVKATNWGVGSTAPVKISKKIHHTFSPQEWAKIPDEYKELGCSPDMNAITGEEKAPPTPLVPSFRTVGGHVHIGYTDRLKSIPENLHTLYARAVCLAFEKEFYKSFPDNSEDEQIRRGLYGSRGAMRVKPYGVEVRSPSSYWFWHGPSSRFETVVSVAKRAVHLVFDNETRSRYIKSAVTQTLNKAEARYGQIGEI